MKKQQGFTLVEVTIILLVLVILSTIMLPQLGNFNRLARFVKVREDVGAICASVKKMLDEVMLGAPYKDPAARIEPVGLLVGPGDTPISGSAGSGVCSLCPDTHELDWQDAAATAATESTDGGVDVLFFVSLLQDHLQQNQPNTAGSNNRYKNPISNPQRFAAGAFFGWRGPYLDDLTADPWGNRYMVNTFGLYKVPTAQSGTAAGLYTTAVVCYSAGPDGAIDTVINQPQIGPAGQANGWVFGDDDQGAVLSAGGPF